MDGGKPHEGIPNGVWSQMAPMQRLYVLQRQQFQDEFLEADDASDETRYVIEDGASDHGAALSRSHAVPKGHAHKNQTESDRPCPRGDRPCRQSEDINESPRALYVAGYEKAC